MVAYLSVRFSRRAGWLVLLAAALLLFACVPVTTQVMPSATDAERAERIPDFVPAPSSTPAPVIWEAATAMPTPAGEMHWSQTGAPSAPPSPAEAMPAPAPSQPVPATPTAAPLVYPGVPTLPSYVTPTPTPTRTPRPTPSVDMVVDDADPGATYVGAWFEGDGGASYRGGCHWAPPGPNFATFWPKLPVAGSYEIYAWGCGDPASRARDVTRD